MYIVVVDGKPQRQMLLPFFYSYVSGRCCTTYWHVTATEYARCYCQAADEIATTGWVKTFFILF